MRSHVLLFILVGIFFLPASVGYSQTKERAYLEDPRGKSFSIPQLNNQDPRSRLKKSSTTDLVDIGNVAIDAVEEANWPEYIKKQIDIAAHACIDGDAPSEKPDVYVYQNDNHRKKNTPPNYLVDYAKWANQPFKRCHLNMICEKQNCALVGYTVLDAEHWKPEQPILANDWLLVLPEAQVFHNKNNLKEVPLLNNGALFIIKTIGQPCNYAAAKTSSTTSTSTEESGCTDAYSWDNSGLNITSQ
jgi:hypothetical protein